MIHQLLDNHRDRLGDDLWELVREIATPLVEVTPLTTLPSPTYERASFRLHFADGSNLKGRRLETKAEAERMAALLRLVDRRFFPDVIGRNRSALLLQWIEGRPVAGARMDPEFSEDCGSLLGALHTVQISKETRGRYGFPASGWRARLIRNIERLVERGALSQRVGDAALATALDHAPTGVSVGLVHGDFCPENLVTTPLGGFAVVDNETLTVDALEYDLGRTWHRWPMSRAEFERFLAGYERYRGAAEFRTHLPYWAIAVLSEAAVFRLSGKTPGANDPLDRLTSILEDSHSDWGFPS